MDELTKIIITSSLTIFGGVIIFVIGQLIGKFVIDPIHDLKKTLGNTQFSIIFHAQAILTPIGDREAEEIAQKTLRNLSCELRSKVGVIPFYGLWCRASFGFLPKKENILNASEEIMGLSNSTHQANRSDKNASRISRIESLLNYEPMDKPE